MKILAQLVGIIAVATFLLSYQMKRRKQIVLVNAISSVLYVVQYIMLGAFEGALLDILSAVSTITAHNKDKGILKKHAKTVLVVMNVALFLAGMSVYKNIFSLFAIAGAILQTSALWITNEKTIRRISFLGAPFWLAYNLASRAYGSAIGSVLSLVSIAVAIYRYDIKRKVSDKTFTYERV